MVGNILDIKANLKIIQSNIKKVIQDALSQAGAGFGGGGKKGKDGKAVGLLATIAKKLGVLGIILSFKPLLDLIAIALNLAMFGILKMLKIIPDVGGTVGAFIDKVEAKISEKMDLLLNAFVIWLSGLPEKIWSFMKLLAPLIKGFLFALPAKIWSLIKFLGPIIGAFITKLVKTLPKIVAAIWGFLKDIWAKIKPFVKDMWTLAKKKINEVWKKVTEKLGELKTGFIEKLTELGTRLIDQLPAKFVAGMSLLASSIVSGIQGIFSRSIFGGGSSGGRGFGGGFDDFISRPGQGVASFSPDDTIIGVKDPGSLGGTTLIFNGVLPQEMLTAMKRELGLDLNRSGRF